LIWFDSPGLGLIPKWVRLAKITSGRPKIFLQSHLSVFQHVRILVFQLSQFFFAAFYFCFLLSEFLICFVFPLSHISALFGGFPWPVKWAAYFTGRGP
jgi:hypothetical protein